MTPLKPLLFSTCLLISASMALADEASASSTLATFSPSLTLGPLTAAAYDDQPESAATTAQPGNAALTNPRRLRTYELPALTVEGAPPSELRDNELVGPYQQPRWTTSRIFPSTRVYVIPEGKVEVEYWYRPTFTRDNTVETRMLAEVEFGLPHRFQLDLYFRTDQEDAGSHMDFAGQFELRWALADWGKIWGNPTFYFEYIARDNHPDKIEPKLLLGGQFGEGWHWGMNFVAELEVQGEEREHEYEFTSALSHTIIDNCFSAGVEFKFSLVDVHGDRGHYQTPFLIGPTFQWRPTGPMYINLETLVGIGAESPRGQITLNVGWEF